MFEIGINSNCECGSNIAEICENVKKAGFNNIMIAFKVGGEENAILEAKTKKIRQKLTLLKLSSDIFSNSTQTLAPPKLAAL